ncbi:MAG: rhodanese-like domain-containing protein [Thermoanaerobaculia bacterium]
MARRAARRRTALLILTLTIVPAAPAAFAATPANPQIDIDGYLLAAHQAAKQREDHRLTEEQFLAMSREPGTLVLDARSRDGFDLLHVRGAVSLPFPDITVASLAATIPNRNKRILIYCNNNFANAPDAFPTKIATASLNISTYIALWSYGYRNVYELGPFVDLAQSKLEFEGTPSTAQP